MKEIGYVSYRDLGNGCSKLKCLIERGKWRIVSFDLLMRLSHVNRNYELYLVGAVKFKEIRLCVCESLL